MDWNTLLTFALGGLTAFIPTIISNRHLSREKDKDREEQRREAKIQSKEKWIERDILKGMDLIEKVLKLLSEMRNILISTDMMYKGQKSGVITKEEFRKRLKSDYSEKIPNWLIEIEQTQDMISSLVYSFNDDKIISGYNNFDTVVRASILQINNYLQSSVEQTDIIGMENSIPVSESAGKFHQALRDKLISLRE